MAWARLLHDRAALRAAASRWNYVIREDLPALRLVGRGLRSLVDCVKLLPPVFLQRGMGDGRRA